MSVVEHNAPQPHPGPGLRDLERQFVLDAHGFAVAGLVGQPIGTTENDRFVLAEFFAIFTRLLLRQSNTVSHKVHKALVFFTIFVADITIFRFRIYSKYCKPVVGGDLLFGPPLAIKSQ